MTPEDKQKLAWFKSCMEGYYTDDAIIQSLKKSIKDLDSMFDTHSISFDDDVRITPEERTARLAKYIDLRDKFMNTLQGVISNQKTVNDIMSYISDDYIKDVIEGVYARGRTWRSYAMDSYYSESGFKDHVNAVLLEAIRKYEKGEDN